MKEVTSAEGALAIILSIVITPLFFVAAFLILKGILCLLAARPLTKLALVIAGKIKNTNYVDEKYPKNKEDRKKKGPFCVKSAVLGALCGLLSFTVLMIPVAGTFETVSSIGTNATQEGTMYNTSVALSDNVASKIMLPIAAPVWSNFTHYTVNDEEINITDEAHLVGVLIEALGEMTSNDQDTIRHSAEVFRQMSALCPNSSLIPCLCADFINAASAHWLQGEDFNGIAMPTLTPSTPGEDAELTTTDDIVATLVKCLDQSTTETMREDLATIANVMAIIAENATVDVDGAIDLSKLFENENVIKKLSVELLKNKRLAPVMSTLVNKQVETSGGQLELPDKESEEYKTMVDNLVVKYQETITEDINEGSLDSLAGAVGETVEQEAGIVLTESEKVAIASTFISEFGNGEDLTSDKVSEFIEKYRKQ